jgi:hypothetical protein
VGEEPAGLARLQDPSPFAQPAHHRVDLLVRPLAQPDEEFVDPPKPGHLQQLVPGHLEDEGGDAQAQKLCQHQHEDGADPLLLDDQPDLEEFERQQHDERHDETTSVASGDSFATSRTNADFTPCHGMRPTTRATMGSR